ncbi:NAD(P)/FAD-dependent oxidoreductase [Mycobacterium sp. NPDC003449]
MKPNIVVIGAGVYGAVVTAELTRRGAAVTVVDAGVPGGGTSGATFSWTNANGAKQPRAYHALNVAGMEAHRRLAREVPGSDWYHESGTLKWGGNDAERATLRRQVDLVSGYGYEVRWLTRAEAVQLEPEINAAELPDDEVAYFPTEGWIAPTRLISYLLSSSDAARVWNDAVVGIDVAGDRVRSVQLASGRQLPADAVVNCAGPRAADIAVLVGLDLPMRNTRGVLVHTAPVALGATRVIQAPDIHLRPDGGGRLQLHSYDSDASAQVIEAGEVTVDQGGIDKIIGAACSLYPAIRAASIESVRVGERPIPGDGLPVLGRAPEIPNFHFAVSHSGVTLSVHAGRLVAAEVLGDAGTAEMASFRFERF